MCEVVPKVEVLLAEIHDKDANKHSALTKAARLLLEYNEHCEHDVVKELADETAKQGVKHVNEMVADISKLNENGHPDVVESPEDLHKACTCMIVDFALAYPMEDWHHDLQVKLSEATLAQASRIFQSKFTNTLDEFKATWMEQNVEPNDDISNKVIELVKNATEKPMQADGKELFDNTLAIGNSWLDSCGGKCAAKGC